MITKWQVQENETKGKLKIYLQRLRENLYSPTSAMQSAANQLQDAVTRQLVLRDLLALGDVLEHLHGVLHKSEKRPYKPRVPRTPLPAPPLIARSQSD